MDNDNVHDIYYDDVGILCNSMF